MRPVSIRKRFSGLFLPGTLTFAVKIGGALLIAAAVLWMATR